MTDRETRSAKRMEGVKARKAATLDALNAQITAAAQAFEDLPSWSAFVKTIQVPNDLTPGVVTMRPELIKIAKPRPLTADECRVLYDLIADLVATNNALRSHAQEVAQMTDNWLTNFAGIQSIGNRIASFANFQHFSNEEHDNGE